MGPREDPAFVAMLDSLRLLRRNWPSRGWSWDSRFNCVASTFANDAVDEARAAIKNVFTNEWTERTLKTAPPPLREIADGSGGVRSDQLMFGPATLTRIFSYGLWWPWRNGVNISMRVGLGGPVDFSHEDRLREAFGAEL